MVRNIPNGRSTAEATHMPYSICMAPAMADFSPVMVMIWNSTKKRTETTTGRPMPPLRMMAPRGAPMKNNTRHANERVNFLCHAT